MRCSGSREACLVEQKEQLLEARRAHRELQPLLLVLELAVEAEHQLEDADVRERAHLDVWGEMGRAVRWGVSGGG